jgi:hypothetical protein
MEGDPMHRPTEVKISPISLPKTSEEDEFLQSTVEAKPAPPASPTPTVTSPREAQYYWEQDEDVVVITEQKTPSQTETPPAVRATQPQPAPVPDEGEPQWTPPAAESRPSDPRQGDAQKPRRITNRTAFRIVATELRTRFEDGFDHELLELFKPVPLKFQRPSSVEEITTGRFTWFEGLIEE